MVFCHVLFCYCSACDWLIMVVHRACDKHTTVDGSFLEGEISRINGSLNLLKNTLAALSEEKKPAEEKKAAGPAEEKKAPSPSPSPVAKDHFVSLMTGFYAVASERYEKLEKQFKAVKSDTEALSYASAPSFLLLSCFICA